MEPTIVLDGDSSMKWVVIASLALNFLNGISTVLPNKTDNKLFNKLLAILNFVSMNFGTSSNDPNKGILKKADPKAK